MVHLGRATAGHSSRRRSGPKCGGGSAHAAHCGIGSDSGGRRPHYSNHAPPHRSSSHPLPASPNPKGPVPGPNARPPLRTPATELPRSAHTHGNTNTRASSLTPSRRRSNNHQNRNARIPSSIELLRHNPPTITTTTTSKPPRFVAFNSLTPSPLPFRVGSSRR